MVSGERSFAQMRGWAEGSPRRAALLAELDRLVGVDESKIGHAHDVNPEALKWCDVKDVMLLVGRHDRLRD